MTGVENVPYKTTRSSQVLKLEPSSMRSGPNGLVPVDVDVMNLGSGDAVIESSYSSTALPPTADAWEVEYGYPFLATFGGKASFTVKKGGNYRGQLLLPIGTKYLRLSGSGVQARVTVTSTTEMDLI